MTTHTHIWNLVPGRLYSQCKTCKEYKLVKYEATPPLPDISGKPVKPEPKDK